MTRTAKSTLKIRAVFSTFVSFVLLTLFTVIQRMVTGFSNYLISGTSIFLPFLEPINILWFLPKEFQFLSITVPQFADICFFGFICDNICSLLYHYYMKIRKDIAFKTEIINQFGSTSSSPDGAIPLLMFDLAQKPSMGVRSETDLDFLWAYIERQDKPCNNVYYDRIQQRDLLELTKSNPKRIYSSLSIKNKHPYSLSLSNSAIHSLGFDFLFFARPVWGFAFSFYERICSGIGGT